MATKSVLKAADEKIEVTSAAEFDPAAFFVKRDGLYVWSDFIDRIVSKAKKMKVSAEFPLVSFDLSKAANDETIEGELPKEHLFDESDVCAIIAALIEKQPKGEEGTLIANGYANLFYTSAFVVCVLWRAGDGGWVVSAWERIDDGWDSGGRVFSPATEA